MIFAVLVSFIVLFTLFDIKLVYDYRINMISGYVARNPFSLSNSLKSKLSIVTEEQNVFEPAQPPLIVALKPNISVIFVGSYGRVRIKPTLIHINSDGFRDDKDYPVEKPKDTIRIVTLGDSFTFGYGVELNETWPKQLETILNNNRKNQSIHYEVLNFGVMGYNAEQEYYFFKLKAMKYNPDVVIIQFLSDDLENMSWVKLMTEKEFERYLKNNRIDVKSISPSEVDKIKHSLRIKIINELDNRIIDDLPKYWPNVAVPYDNLDSLIKQKLPNTKVLLVPFDNGRVPVVPLLRKFSQAHGWCFLDLSKVIDGPLESINKYLISPYEPHPNPKAYHIFAERIYNGLKDCGYII